MIRTSRESSLWVLAVLLWGLGDVSTTVIGLSLGAVEQGVVASEVLSSSGVVGLYYLKFATLCWFRAGYQSIRSLLGETALGIPLGLSILGAGLVGINVSVILASLG